MKGRNEKRRLYLKKVELKNFRNHKEAFFEFIPGINVIVGENGCGKSNLLEAIYVLMKGKSFRPGPDEGLVNSNERAAILRGLFLDQDRLKKIEMEIDVERGKEIQVNGQPIGRIKDLRKSFAVAVFSPEDLKIVKGGPEEKRAFLDEVGGDISLKYDYVKINYLRALKQRNNLLKQIKLGQQNRTTLDLWNERLISFGVKLIEERRNTLGAIRAISSSTFFKIYGSNRGLELNYTNEIFEDRRSDEEAFKARLKEAEPLEIERGISMIGPHRDDISILLGGKDVRFYGSQGEQRVISLVLRLTQHELLTKDDLTVSLLLMDDVLSELDEVRRSNLLRFILRLKQTIITGTNLDSFNEGHPNSINLVATEGTELKAGAC